jgi:hypothetical protein
LLEIWLAAAQQSLLGRGATGMKINEIFKSIWAILTNKSKENFGLNDEVVANKAAKWCEPKQPKRV